MLKFIQKNLIFLIIAVITGGLLNVKFFGGFQFTPLICLVAAVVMIYPSLVPLDFGKIKKVKKYKKIIGISVLLNFVLAPMIAYGIGALFLSDEPSLRLGLMVLALLPGGGMVTTWALKSKADMIVTVGIILINLLLAIVLVPFGISFMMNKLQLEGDTNSQKEIVIGRGMANSSLGANFANEVEPESCVIEKATKGKASCGLGGGKITPLKIALPIIFIVIFPLLLALGTQRLIKAIKGREFFNKAKKKFGAFSNLGLLIVLFILMSLENNQTIFEQTHLVLMVAWSLLLFYGLTFVGPYILYRKFYFNSQGKALFWGSYLRYITLALGLAISLVFQDESLAPIILVVVLSYLVQIPLSFVIAKKLKGYK